MKKNIAIACSSLAGAGKAVVLAETIARELSKRNIHHTVFIDEWPDDYNSFTDVFIVGGDGTLNYFVNKYKTIKTPLSIFKGGTGNDFHWLLYADKTVDQQIETVLYKLPKPIDLGKCNDRFFINGIGVGFEGEVARALSGKKKLPGKLSFFTTVLKKIMTYRSEFYSIVSAEQTINGKKLLIDISNGKRAGGGFYVSPEAKPDDGLFDIVMANAMKPLKRFRYLPVIEKGKHLKLPFIQHFRTKQIIIAGGQLQYHLDGEYFEADKIAVSILPGALNFIY